MYILYSTCFVVLSVKLSSFPKMKNVTCLVSADAKYSAKEITAMICGTLFVFFLLTSNKIKH